MAAPEPTGPEEHPRPGAGKDESLEEVLQEISQVDPRIEYKPTIDWKFLTFSVLAALIMLLFLVASGRNVF